MNPTVGDIEGNVKILRSVRAEAARGGADLVIASELSMTGYPPEDLVLRDAFINKTREAVLALSKDTLDGGPGLLVGSPWVDEDKLYNAAILLDSGEIVGSRY